MDRGHNMKDFLLAEIPWGDLIPWVGGGLLALAGILFRYFGDGLWVKKATCKKCFEKVEETQTRVKAEATAEALRVERASELALKKIEADITILYAKHDALNTQVQQQLATLLHGQGVLEGQLQVLIGGRMPPKFPQ